MPGFEFQLPPGAPRGQQVVTVEAESLPPIREMQVEFPAPGSGFARAGEHTSEREISLSTPAIPTAPPPLSLSDEYLVLNKNILRFLTLGDAYNRKG